MPNIYKKKNPRAPYIRQIIIYSVMLILCIIAKLWAFLLIFVALIAFSAFMLYRNKDKESYSIADYINKYDSSFPTEDPKAKKRSEKKQYEDEREKAYLQRLEEIEEEFDYDYGDED